MKKSESQNVEYKRSWHDEYLKWVCGFANAKGGTIWIGIDDDKSVCGVEKSKKLMDYMERKGSGLGLMLDAYAKEVPNPRQLEPKFYSSSGSFHVVLPNLNFDVTQGVLQGVPQGDTQGDTQGGTQGVTQDVTQGVTQAGLSPLDLKIVEHIRNYPNVTTEELARRLGCVPMTIKRHLAKLPNVRYVGHGYSGHWEVD